MNYEKNVEELINILKKAQEEHWATYFNEVLELHQNGKKNASYKKVLNSYGGMCSFNDMQLNFISDEEVLKVKSLRSNLRSYCKANKKGILGVFGR